MRVRDDKDLAVTQLLARRAPGSSDDPRCATPSRLPARRAPASPAAAPAPGTERTRLAPIRAETERLTAQLAGLPTGELRQLDQWPPSAHTAVLRGSQPSGRVDVSTSAF